MAKTKEPEVEQDVVLELEIVQQLDTFRTQVVRLQEESRAIQIVDEAGEGAALIFIAGVKQIERDLEEYRDALVRPHNNKVRTVNKSVKEIAGLADALVTAMDAKRDEFLKEKQRRIDEANRLAAAEAERLRIEKEAKEKALREEAERLQREAERLETERIEREIQAEVEKAEAERKQKEAAAAVEAARLKAIADKEAAEKAIREGHAKEAEKLRKQAEASKQAEEAARVKAEQEKAEEAARLQKEEDDRKASLAEQAKLEKASIKAEAKADIVAEQAATVAPTIQFNDSMGTRVLDNGAKIGTKEVNEVYMLNGLPVYADPPKNKKVMEYLRNESGIPKELKEPGYDRYWILDVAAIVRDVKNGNPVPGFATTSRNKTVGRR
jgi:hypothetical protein